MEKAEERTSERTSSRWIDLTRPLCEGIPVYPGDPLFQARPFAEHTTDGFRGTRWAFGSHTGTHLDAPFHYFVDGETLDSFSVDFFVGDAAVLDLRSTVGVGSERFAAPRRVGRPVLIEPSDLEPFEPIFDAVPFVFLRVGWAERFGRADFYNAFPSLTPETADWLADFPKLRILGLETPSLVAFPTDGLNVADVSSPTSAASAADRLRSFDPEFLPDAFPTEPPSSSLETKFSEENGTDGAVAADADAEPGAPLADAEFCADAECHRILLGRRPPILLLEGLVSLERLPAFAPPSEPGERVDFDAAKTFETVVFPLLIERSDGCPARVATRLRSVAAPGAQR
ncbi:MAG: cyclase family protein [Thermoguttaceae bacterium]|nr:cyclase family protein [Thermoguttaceae bacterium]